MDIDPNGLAAGVGIRPGDLIVSANGEDLADVHQLREIDEKEINDRGVRFLIEREGYRRFLVVKR